MAEIKAQDRLLVRLIFDWFIKFVKEKLKTFSFLFVVLDPAVEKPLKTAAKFSAGD